MTYKECKEIMSRNIYQSDFIFASFFKGFSTEIKANKKAHKLKLTNK